MPPSAVLMPNWIGDFACALSVVKQKIALEKIEVTLIVPAHLASLSVLYSPLPSIIYSRGKFDAFRRSIRQVKKGGFSTLYVLPHSFSAAWFAFRTGIGVRRGMRWEHRSLLLTEVLNRATDPKQEHMTAEYARILDVPFTAPEKWKGSTVAEPDPRSRGVIVLCPGAAYGSAKKWDGFAELPAHMPDQKFIVIGDTRDRVAGDALAQKSGGRVTNYAGSTTLDEAVRLIAGAALVISNDSGLMHVAGYIGTPVIGIFGSTSPLWTRPLGSASTVASVPCDCSPCYDRQCRFNHYRCLTGVTPEQVSALARDMLSAPLSRIESSVS